jgi:hypothetical protein
MSGDSVASADIARAAVDRQWASDLLFGTAAPSNGFESQVASAYVALTAKLVEADFGTLNYLARGVRDSCRYYRKTSDATLRAECELLLRAQLVRPSRIGKSN